MKQIDGCEKEVVKKVIVKKSSCENVVVKMDSWENGYMGKQIVGKRCKCEKSRCEKVVVRSGCERNRQL